MPIVRCGTTILTSASLYQGRVGPARQVGAVGVCQGGRGEWGGGGVCDRGVGESGAGG